MADDPLLIWHGPDDRIECRTCKRLDDLGHCSAWRELGASKGYRPVTQPRRCPQYLPRADVADQRKGVQRWPWLAV
jgi:hypothetical protein